VPKRSFKAGTIGIEISKPQAVKNKAKPTSASFKRNLFFMCGIYKIQVPMRILMDENTQAGAKKARLFKIRRNEFMC